jgi:hypothetical protein
MSKWYRDLLAHQVAQQCVSHAAKYVKPAFAGDEEAAFSLSCSLENHERGLVAVAMWRAKVPVDSYRAYFSSVWDHDHRFLIDAASNRRTLAYMFRYAAFPLPQELPSTVTLWRGTSKLPIKEAKEGYSWTTDRDVACWFAMRFAEQNNSPLVLIAEVAKTDIALFHQERNESEAVLMRPPANVRIDGTLDDWAQGHARQRAKTQAHNASLSTVAPAA